MSEGTTKSLARDKSFECPCCGATLDERGHEFASQVVREGATFFCNNPACNGGRYSPLKTQLRGEISTSDL